MGGHDAESGRSARGKNIYIYKVDYTLDNSTPRTSVNTVSK